MDGLLPPTSSTSRIEMQNISRATMDGKTKQWQPVSTYKLDFHARPSYSLSYDPRNTSQLTVPMELGESAIIHWSLPSNSNVTGGVDEYARSSDILPFCSSNALKLSAPMELRESPIIHWPLPSSNSNINGGPGSSSSERPSTHLNPLTSAVPASCFLSGSVVSGETNAFPLLGNENAVSNPLIIAPRSSNLHTDGQQTQVEAVPLNIGKIPLNTICKLCY